MRLLAVWVVLPLALWALIVFAALGAYRIAS